MRIGIVGLGLIGGSLAKTIKKNTNHVLMGMDINKGAVASAFSQEAIDGEINADTLSGCDVVIVALHPRATIDFIISNKEKFKSGSIVIDVCGVKREIVDKVEAPLREQGVEFVGCHPMAGREFSGFEYSVDNLFERASFIMTPTDFTSMRAVREISTLAYDMGFARVVMSTPQEHDRIIAFTSQLAHIVSSAYVKSPNLMRQSGFSAGSFMDLTRVAKLNEDMWTELFLMNGEDLTFEIDQIIKHLTEYRNCIEQSDAKTLNTLLREGRELKESV